MTLELILTSYGYPMLLLGTLLEGEAPVLIGGLLARAGSFHLPWVVLVAFSGTFAADQSLFHLGRWRGASLIRRREAWRLRAHRVRRLLDRHGAPLVLGLRFCYGLRTVSSLAIGMSGFDPRRYLILNLLGCGIWASSLASLGYLLGGVVEARLGGLPHPAWLMGIGLLVAACGWLVQLALGLLLRWVRRRRGDSGAGLEALPV